MRIVSYRQNGGPWRAGAERDGGVVDIGDSVRALLAGGTAALAAAAKRGTPVSGKVQIGPVVPDPEKIICFGLNYRKHAEETGMAIPQVPTFFPKYRNSLVGDGEPIVLPIKYASEVDYEVELAAIIGKRCKNVTESEVLQYVGGYSILNDVSAR